MTTDLARATAVELAQLYRTKAASPVETTRAVLARAEAVNPKLNALTLVDADAALAAAMASEARWAAGEPASALDGVPVTVKELVRVKGWPHSMGSRLADKTPATEDAPAVARLREAGAIVWSQNASPEYGHKGVTDSPLHGLTRNPWNLERTPGGSSGGTGAAVAASLGPLGIGTDGGGSVRIPAAFCGLVGLKATYGRIPAWPPSMHGDLANTGPMTRTVADAALMLAVMAGPDDWDRQSLDAPPADYVGRLREGVRGLRVGWSLDLGCCRVDPEIGQVARRAAEAFQELGATVEDAKVSLPDTREMIHLMWNAHYAGNYAQFLERFRAKMDPGLVAAIEDGRRYTAEQYVDMRARKHAYCDAVRALFDTYDLLLMPTVSVAAFEVGRLNPTHFRQHPWDWFDWAGFSYPFNFSGNPAATVPAGFTPSGMPVGLQIVGRRLADLQVLQASAAFEQARPWAQKRPAVAG